jgi:hypothetical protein
MKKLIFLLLLIPQLLLSQNSWFELEVQFDYYAQTESFALLTQAGDTTQMVLLVYDLLMYHLLG